MQSQPPPGYQPGGWQQPYDYQPMAPQPPQKPKTQTFNLEYNVAAGLGYLPFLFIHILLPLVFLSTEPKTNKFVRFHAFQSLFMTLVGLVGGIGGYVLLILSWFLVVLLSAATESPAFAVLGFVVTMLFVLFFAAFGLFMLVSTVIACIKAFSGETWKVPFIGRLAERFA